MNILKSDLDSAARQGLVTTAQADALWTYLQAQRPDEGRFKGLHVLYYFGGVLILASMSWFLTTAWEDGTSLMVISALFAFMYVFVGNGLWRRDLKIPGGLLITAAVGLTPVFIFGLQKELGFWPSMSTDNYGAYHQLVRGSWLTIELGTIAAACLALCFYPFTFITFPLALTVWYMSMDLTPFLFGDSDYSWDQRKVVSCWFGALVLGVSFIVDRRFTKDFAFWTYLAGMLAFWGGLTMMNSDNEISKFVYCLMNVGFLFVSVYLRRRVFLVFGTMGVLTYLGHLAYSVFKDSFAFPIVLALIGIFVVFLGVHYQKQQARLEGWVESLLPTFLTKWRPAERA